MSGRSWSDQPAALEGAEIVFRSFLRFPGGGQSAEVRRAGERWFLSVGNLFGSQTLECSGPEAALRALTRALSARGDEAVAAPLGEGWWTRVMEGEG